MHLNEMRRIDWSHEREWRWTDSLDRCSCPGLPVWLGEEPIQFTQAMIVVPTIKEAQRVLDLLKQLFDAGHHNYGYAYNTEVLSETRIIALENLREETLASIRLEDIPASRLGQFKRPEASDDLCRRVEESVRRARGAAKAAAEEFATGATRAGTGHIDGFGWAYVTVLNPQSPFVSAMLKVGAGDVIGGIGYSIDVVDSAGYSELAIREAAAEAARTVLKGLFPDVRFGVRTVWD